MSEWLDLLGALALLMGAFLCLVTAIALVRFPDVLTKMHSITKPQVLGILLVAAGTTLSLRTWWVFAVCTIMVAMQLLTSPVSATMLSRSAYRSGLVDHAGLVMDELSDDLARAGYKQTERKEHVPPGPEMDFSLDDFTPKGELPDEGDESDVSNPHEETPPDDLGAHEDTDAEAVEEVEDAVAAEREHDEGHPVDVTLDDQDGPPHDVTAEDEGDVGRTGDEPESDEDGDADDADDDDEDDELEDIIASDSEEMLDTSGDDDAR